MNDELLQLFPQPVVISSYGRNYEKELEWIREQDSRVVEQREFTTQSRFSPARQSVNSFILDAPELKKIRTFIETKLNEYVTHVLGSKDKFVITQSWFNKSKKGESHSEHSHPNSIVSGVWYPVINKQLPPLQFMKTPSKQIVFNVEKYNNFNSETFLLPLNPGELVIFPSTLSHSVPPNKYDEERISLSFNTWVKGNMGTIESLTYLPVDRLI